MRRLPPLIGHLLLAALLGTPQVGGMAPASGQGFGRWETPLQQCRMGAGGQPQRPCRRLRLEQNLEGLLSVRFVGDGEGGRLASEELTFAGVLPEGQQPMRCQPDGRCQNPPQPLQLLVGSVAWTRFNDRGLVDGLPQARLARGHCQLTHQVIRCEAHNEGASEGASWTAEARLGPAPPSPGRN
jgi:hypothetical protein